ncbi:pre-mRNA 3'-end-processing factor FIP1 isoform X2 [Neocloeon triangulifer]|uniref:pre-mRNA 3'-end-processing factor FIP1 isoform X2 n=1 Tax=Neocloeon triangulifer TaxID=2078957 RepID=UPI00286F9282|nr:pre-mRNA 3'-end-processing factor FIP1 isoform X2 [Neocloeon triangulifer]
MADDPSNEDSWLYGDSNPEPPENEDQVVENGTPVKDEAPSNSPAVETPAETDGDVPVAPEPDANGADGRATPTEDEAMDLVGETGEAVATEEGETDDKEAGKDDGEEDEDDDDDSDDDVQVTIGDIKTSTTYASSMNMKRGPSDKAKQQQGKFSIDEFEAVGTINGVPAHEYNLDSMEDKPWRMPGADITDYFNYGFNEDTWRAYCEKQKRLRINESGVGLAGIGATTTVSSNSVVKTLTGSIPVSIVNENSKYASNLALKRAGPPPGRKGGGSIDVIGGEREGQITVMGSERPDFSGSYPNLNVPPPGFGGPPPFGGGNYGGGGGGGGGGGDFYPPEADPYYNNYEPTQEHQWNNQPRWENRGSATNVVVPLGPQDEASRHSRDSAGDKEEGEKSERRSSRHKHRSRSRSAERTRSSKKRHKSRSRSPSQRHRSKKKSRRSEREDE